MPAATPCSATRPTRCGGACATSSSSTATAAKSSSSCCRASTPRTAARSASACAPRSKRPSPAGLELDASRWELRSEEGSDVNLATLFAAADAALYEAKSAGRNRVDRLDGPGRVGSRVTARSPSGRARGGSWSGAENAGGSSARLKRRPRLPDKADDGLRYRCSAALRRRARGLRPAPEGALAADGADPRRAAPDRRRGAAGARGHRGGARAHRRPGPGPRGVRPRGRGRLLLRDHGPEPLPRQRLPPARERSRSSAARSPSRCAPSRTSGCPRSSARSPSEQRGIVLLTGTTGSGKSTTLAAMIDHINSHLAAAHRHARGPDRVPAPRQALDHQPARGRPGHRELRPRDAARPAPGPRRDPRRRDARRGDRPHRALGRRDRATSCSRRCTPSTRPRPSTAIIDFFPPHLQQQARVMLASTLRGVVGQRLVPRAGRRRPRRDLRGARRHRPRPGPDPQPERDRADHRGDLRGRVLRDADLRPGAAQARDGGQRHRGGRARGRQPARTTSS